MIWPGLFLALLCCGCSAPAYWQGEAGSVAPSAEQIVLSGIELISRIGFADIWQTTEYLRFDDGRRSGEMVLVAADQYALVSLDWRYDVERAIAAFRHNESTQHLGALQRLELPTGTLFWRSFSIGASSCAGLVSNWPVVAEVPLKRPRNGLIGYLCSMAALPQSAMETFLEGLRLNPRPPNEWAVELRPDPPALAAAQGVADNGAGVPGFPCLVARIFSLSDGTGRSH